MVNPLGETDQAILRHVLRYRLTTPHILNCSGILEMSDAALASEELQRLASLDLLASAPLLTGYDQPVYYHLTATAAVALGQDAAIAKALKTDARAVLPGAGRRRNCATGFYQG